jgi:hypothetical protein
LQFKRVIDVFDMDVSEAIVFGDAHRVPVEPSPVDLLTWSSPERAYYANKEVGLQLEDHRGVLTD